VAPQAAAAAGNCSGRNPVGRREWLSGNRGLGRSDRPGGAGGAAHSRSPATVAPHLPAAQAQRQPRIHSAAPSLGESTAIQRVTYSSLQLGLAPKSMPMAPSLPTASTRATGSSHLPAQRPFPPTTLHPRVLRPRQRPAGRKRDSWWTQSDQRDGTLLLGVLNAACPQGTICADNLMVKAYAWYAAQTYAAYKKPVIWLLEGRLHSILGGGLYVGALLRTTRSACRADCPGDQVQRSPCRRR